MSDLLQQAMIDAAALREAAIKNAENALIEKYSQEFNQTVQKLLEQEELASSPEQALQPAPTPDLNVDNQSNADSTEQEIPDLSAASSDPMSDLSATGLPTDKKDAFSKVPGSFSSEEDEMITINFDQIRATLNEMLGEKYDTASSEYMTGDAQDKGGNPTMRVKVKGSKNAVTEKWAEDELEEMTASDTQNEAEGGELEEMELMDEEPQQSQQAPVAGASAQTSAQPAQQQAAAGAQKGKKTEQQIVQDFLAKLKKKDPSADETLVQDMRTAGVLKTPSEKFLSALQKLKKASPFLLGGVAGTVAMQTLLQMAINPSFADAVLTSVGLKEQELDEQSAGAASKVRGQELKAQGEKEIARGTAMDAAEEKQSAGTSTMTPKTMEEEIELTEEELQELAEELRVDLKVGNLSDGYMGSTETQKREQRTVELAAARDSKAAEEREAELEKMKDLMQENKNLKALNNDTTKSLSALKEHLEKVNLSNAKLLYTNKALGSISLNERQKNQIVESISKAGSVLEAKTIYETLQNAVENNEAKKEAPQSLREALNKAPSPFAVKKTPANSLNDVMADRMKALAGIKK